MICSKCHAEGTEGKKFCGKCGASFGTISSPQNSVSPTPGPPHCANCGAEIASGKRFCGACGSPLGVSQAESPAAVSRAARQGPLSGGQTEMRTAVPSSVPAQVSVPRIARDTPSAMMGSGVSTPSVGLPSARTLGYVVGLIAVLLCVAAWFIWGVELDLITNPGGAEVVLDGKPVGTTAGQAGSLVVPHVSHGTHTLSIARPGFDVWSQTFSVGWLRISHPLNVKLPVPSFPLAVVTNPGGAKVQLDGNDVGTSDESGNFIVQGVPRGQHVVTVMLDGYPTWSSSFWIQSPFTTRADLAEAAAAAQQEIASRLSRAQMLFEQRQYQAAVAECDAILRLDPGNQQATSLKSQVQQTLSILGAR